MESEQVSPPSPRRFSFMKLIGVLFLIWVAYELIVGVHRDIVNTNLMNEPEQLQFVSSWTLGGTSQTPQLTDTGTNFIKHHMHLFPVKKSNLANAEKLVDKKINTVMVQKEADLYYSTLVQDSGSVLNINQTSTGGAYLQVMTPSGAIATILYDGQTGSIVQGSDVTFIGLPVETYSYKSVANIQEQSVLYDGVYLK